MHDEEVREGGVRITPYLPSPYYLISDFVMSHLWGEPEEIAVSLDAAGRPSVFVWHGRRHPIEKWGDAFLIETEWWSEHGEVRRQMWPVVTRTGLKCDIFFDFASERWWMSGVYD